MRNRINKIIACLVTVLGVVWVIITPFSARASDCDDFFLDNEGSGYEITCEEQEDLTGGDPDARAMNKRMTALAKDGSHFIFAFRSTAGLRTYLTYNEPVSGALRHLLGNSHGDAKPGRNVGPVDTIETTARLNGRDNKCLVFQRLGRREYSGIKKVNLGMICTEGDISLAYSALEKLLLPS